MSKAVDSAPIFHLGKGPAVLGLHGFSSTPFELSPVAHALIQTGCSVSVPLLAGHGHTVESLAHATWMDWLSSAESAFRILQSAAGQKPLAVVGSSMGALLGLLLAQKHPDRVAALVLLAVPIRLPRLQTLAIRGWALLPSFLQHGPCFALRKRNGCDVTDPAMKLRNPTLDSYPVSGVAQLLNLAQQARRILGQIKTPTLVLHGSLDRTVPPRYSDELITLLGARVMERHILPRSGHILGLDKERQTVSAMIHGFVEKWCA